MNHKELFKENHSLNAQYIGQVHLPSKSVETKPDKTDLWNAPYWGAVGTAGTILFGLIGAGISIWAIKKQTQTKKLTYTVTSNEDVLNISSDIREKLEIKFEEKEISGLQLIIIRFENAGNVPILKDEYERPLTITFGKDANILSNELHNQIPQNLGIVTKIFLKPSLEERLPIKTTLNNENFVVRETNSRQRLSLKDYSQLFPPDQYDEVERIFIKPTLLNKNDSFELKILVTEYLRIEVDGRIAGIQRIEHSLSRKKINKIFQFVAGFFVGSFLVIISYIISYYFTLRMATYSVNLLILTVSALLLLLLYLFYFMKKYLIHAKSNAN